LRKKEKDKKGNVEESLTVSGERGEREKITSNLGGTAGRPKSKGVRGSPQNQGKRKKRTNNWALLKKEILARI